MKLVSVDKRNRHRELSRICGKASEYACFDCGKPARDWSQTHGTDGLDSGDYHPRCRSCHKKYDAPFAAKQDASAASARSRAYWSDPNHRAQMAASALATWQDPEVKAKRLAARRKQPDILTEDQWEVIKTTLDLPQRKVAKMLGKDVKFVTNARTRLKRGKVA